MVSARPRIRSSINRREAAKKSAFLDSSPSRSSARTWRFELGHVEGLRGHRQEPQVRLKACVGGTEVGGHVGELDGQIHPHLELVRSPVGGERGVERVGKDHRLPGCLCMLDRCAANGTARLRSPAYAQHRASAAPSKARSRSASLAS